MLHYSYYLYLFLSDYVAGAAVLISPYFQRWKIRQPSIFIISGNKSVVLITIIRREASSSSYDNCVGVGIRNGTWIPKHDSGSQMIKKHSTFCSYNISWCQGKVISTDPSGLAISDWLVSGETFVVVPVPPIKMTPSSVAHELCHALSLFRWWVWVHSPSEVRVEQLNPSLCPPQAISPSWVWLTRLRSTGFHGNFGSWHELPSLGLYTSLS